MSPYFNMMVEVLFGNSHRVPGHQSKGQCMQAPNPTGHNQWYPFQNRPLSPLDKPVNPAVILLFDVDHLPGTGRFVVIGAGVHGM